MIKRGIGAVVLAIIAALLLGYLLKDKSSERQEVVDMKLPGAPEMKIPSLTGSDQDTTSSSATLTAEGKAKEITDKVKNAGTSIVASASGSATKLADTGKAAINNSKETVANATEKAANLTATTKPGFAIRPSQKNEQREIVDTVKPSTADKSAAMAHAQDNTKNANNKVVASTSAPVQKPKAQYKPRIVDEKKPTKTAKVKKPEKKVAKKQVAKPKPQKQVAKPVAPVAAPAPAAATPSGKYAIQLLATSSQSRAKKLAKTMKGEGYQSFITQANRNNKVLYRVRIGGYSDRNGAIKAQENMKRRYQKNFFVQNSLVVSN